MVHIKVSQAAAGTGWPPAVSTKPSSSPFHLLRVSFIKAEMESGRVGKQNTV